MDGGLKSLPTSDQAVDLIQNAQGMCSTVCVRMHKVLSNSKNALKSISMEDRAKVVKDLDLNKNVLPFDECPVVCRVCRQQVDCSQVVGKASVAILKPLQFLAWS